MKKARPVHRSKSKPAPPAKMKLKSAPFGASPPHSGSSAPVLVLTLFVPGFGHWLMRSRHALSYLLLAALVWFITLSAILAFKFSLFSLLFLLLPMAYHVLALHDAKAEWYGREDRRILQHIF
ncbi:Uncharacterised protein [uncultured archaeon]|nr:Uncharacterised protein [uncultured archaeon]